MTRGRGAPPLDWKEIGALLLVMAPIVFFWNSLLLYPLKILVVFFHELSHGAAALLTGGRVIQIQLEGNESGRTFSQGGWPFVVVSAGYLGSLLFGGVILSLSTRKKLARGLSAILGIFLVGAALLWVRPFISFGFLFGLLTGISLVLAGNYLNETVNAFLLKTIGLTSCLYAVLDIKSDILDRPTACSDAYILAQKTGVPAIIWGTVWFAIAVAGATYFIYHACRKSPQARKA